jgi:hypothetical protein
MTWLYNACRALARALAAGAVGVVLNGKAEPLGVHFDGPGAVVLGGGLLVAAYLAFEAESWAKRRAGL